MATPNQTDTTPTLMAAVKALLLRINDLSKYDMAKDEDRAAAAQGYKALREAEAAQAAAAGAPSYDELLDLAKRSANLFAEMTITTADDAQRVRSHRASLVDAIRRADSAYYVI